MPWHAAPGCESLGESKGCKVNVDGSEMAVFKLGGQYYAMQDFCPHRGGSLGHGDIDEEGWVACPLHAWFFNIKTGESATNEAMRIKIFPCKEERGKVWVDLPDERSFP